MNSFQTQCRVSRGSVYANSKLDLFSRFKRKELRLVTDRQTDKQTTVANSALAQRRAAKMRMTEIYSYRRCHRQN